MKAGGAGDAFCRVVNFMIRHEEVPRRYSIQLFGTQIVDVGIGYSTVHLSSVSVESVPSKTKLRRLVVLHCTVVV